MASSSTPSPISRRSVSMPPLGPTLNPSQEIEILFTLPSVRIVSFTTSNPISRPSSNGASPVKEEEVGSLPWVSSSERIIAIGPFRIYRLPSSVAFLHCSTALRPILPKSQCWCVDDASSMFVLQIRPPQYWRIEIPNNTSEDKTRAEELKDVFAKVLLFEKTRCPFERNFTVELPEPPQTPIRRKPWKPVQSPRLDTSKLPEAESPDAKYRVPSGDLKSATSSSSPFTHVPDVRPLSSASRTEQYIASSDVTSQSQSVPLRIQCRPTRQESAASLTELSVTGRKSLEQTSITELHLAQRPADQASQASQAGALPSSLLDSSVAKSNICDVIGGAKDWDDQSASLNDMNITPKLHFQEVFQPLKDEPQTPNRPQALKNCSRSITAPVLSLVTSPPSKRGEKLPIINSSATVESDSDISSSADSFHSIQSWHSPLAPPSPPSSRPPSPTRTYPYPHNDISLPKRRHHRRDVSEITVTPETPHLWDLTSTQETESAPGELSPPPPKTPTLETDGSEKSDEEQFEVVTPPTLRSNFRHRATTSSNSRRRALSPLPAAVNLFSPPRRRSRRLQTARHLPTAIIQKTCEILLSPPSHLLHLMLSIASKIASGEWRGVLSGYGEAVHWDFEDEYTGEGWAEDDYGISLPKSYAKGTKPSTHVAGSSWDVD